MKITGQQLIDAVARRLNEEDVRCYGSAIVAKINSLTAPELAQLTDHGDVTAWHNDRVEKEQEEKRQATGLL
jgi:hypothetical protein